MTNPLNRGLVEPLALAVLLLCPLALVAQEDADLPRHEIPRFGGEITVDGVLAEPAWQRVSPVGGFLFPWWESGEREQTEARMLWDDDNLYVSFVAHDHHISAVLTQRDDPVSQDDAVEVFVAPDTAAVTTYYNFEFNALGTILDRSSLHEGSSSWNAEGVVVAVTIDGTLNDDTDEDRLWTAEIAIPFSTFEGSAPDLPPLPGQSWRLNLYRIGGKTNPQFSVWSDTQTEKPQYHVPERFGFVRFVGAHPTAVEGTALGQLKRHRR